MIFKKYIFIKCTGLAVFTANRVDFSTHSPKPFDKISSLSSQQSISDGGIKPSPKYKQKQIINNCVTFRGIYTIYTIIIFILINMDLCFSVKIYHCYIFFTVYMVIFLLFLPLARL